MDPFEIIAAGTIATALTDAWQQGLKRVAGLPATNWSVVGRWVSGLREGRVYRPALASDPAVSGEAAIGWAFHYLVGIAYAAIFAVIVTLLGGVFGPFEACTFGLLSVAAPWLLLKPALGLGLFARRVANPWMDRLATVTTHLAFGVGLYVGAVVVMSVRAA